MNYNTFMDFSNLPKLNLRNCHKCNREYIAEETDNVLNGPFCGVCYPIRNTW